MTVKTAISLDPDLLRRVDSLAAELKLPRSRVLALAADDYLRRRESRVLLERLDRVYAEEPETTEEAGLRKAHRASHRRIMERAE